MQSIPAIRKPRPCGTDTKLSAGREVCQWHWYEWIARHAADLSPSSILDVGAGLCDGLDRLKRHYPLATVRGLEPDSRLESLNRSDLIIGSLEDIADDQFDVVTCLDVIEHVVEDLSFLEHLLRIARRRLYVTTPNFERSKARNPHHCRELTPDQFQIILQPDELWTGSPTGSQQVRFDISQPVPGPDGQPWPHIAGVWNTLALRVL